MTIKFIDGREIKIDGATHIVVYTDAYGYVKGELWVPNEHSQLVKNGITFRFKEVASISN